MTSSTSGSEAHGTRGMVVSGHPLATQAGLRMLDQGGSASDAVIASAAMLCVVLPQAVTIGGDAFGLFYDAAGRSVHALNASGRAPRATELSQLTAPDIEHGARAPTVPALVRGWETAHRRFGRLAWRNLFVPAIEAADRGAPTSRILATALKNNLELVSADAGLSALLMPNGRPLVAGEVFRQPALARSLRAIADDGAAAFYDGAIAESLTARLRRNGGLLDRDDLSACSADWSEPLEIIYRGHTVVVPPPNSFGILGLLQLQHIDANGIDLAACSEAARINLLIEAAEAAFRCGAVCLADPDALGVDPRQLLQNARSVRSAGTVEPQKGGTAVAMAVDADGNAAVIVESIFTLFGSGVLDAATGILLNSRMRGFSLDAASPNALAPGKRPAHTLSPMMVLRDGKLSILLGTPGALGQTVTLVQAVTNAIDRGLSMREAIAAPRWSYDLNRSIILERGLGEEVALALSAASIAVASAPVETPYFGSIKAVTVGPDGQLAGYADPRREGAAGGR